MYMSVKAIFLPFLMYMSVKAILPLFLHFFNWILKLFWNFGIFCFTFYFVFPWQHIKHRLINYLTKKYSRNNTDYKSMKIFLKILMIHKLSNVTHYYILHVHLG
jgi:hypothetical protein